MRATSSIILRKIRGRLTPLIRGGSVFALPSSPHGSHGSGAHRAAVGFLLAIVAVVALLAWSIAHPIALHAHGLSGYLAVSGATKIVELRAKATQLRKDANKALEDAQAKAKAEGRALSADELKAQDDFDTQIAAADQEVKLEERKLEREKYAGSGRRETGDPEPTPRARVEQLHNRAEDDRAKGFRSHREFALAVMDASSATDIGDVSDERLRSLAVMDKDDKMALGGMAFMLPVAFAPRSLQATVGSDEQGSYSDQYGGYLVPKTYLPDLLTTPADDDPTAGRTQSVPMATPIVELPARTDKDHTTSVSGGFTWSRRAEAAALAASRGQMEVVTLKATGLFGLAYATNEILTDSAISFAAIIEAGFKTQLPAHMLNEKLRGLGASEFLGVNTALDASSKGPTISIAKESGQAAKTIVTNNVLNMRSRVWGYQNAIWMANHDAYPQLAVLQIAVGTGGVPVYQPSLVEGRPDMLLGRPIFYNEFMNTIGEQGDIGCYNFSQFLEGTYQPVESASSIHVRFVNHETAFKFWLRNAGAPWWRVALTPKKSANKLSPFVVLDAR